MSQTRSTVRRVVTAAIAARCVDRSVDIRDDVEVLSVLDSMAMLSVLADFQDSLQLDLEPAAIIRIFKCRWVGEIVAVLEECAGAVQEAHS